MAEFGATFGKPFAEQVAAFRLRLGHLVPTSAWDDLWQSAHDRAFMVAGATKADLLADLARAVDKSISEGLGLEEFRREFRDIVERHGWHGWTGEGSKAGEAWRTRVIYKTNAATSYAAGRLAQLKAKGFQYFVYRHGGSEQPRHIHRHVWDGLVLPADHPFWDTHYPPNGWGCSCYVVGARSLAGARRLGGDPDKVLPPNWQALEPKTGAPFGIDKGWAYAPGGTAIGQINDLRGKLDKLPAGPSIDLIQSWLRSSVFSKWMEHPEGAWPLLMIGAEDGAKIGAQRLVADVSAETMRKQLRRHPELSVEDYVSAQRTVSAATLTIKDGEHSLIFLRDEPDGHVVVVKATKTGQGLFVTSLRRMSGRAGERAREVRRLLSKE